MKRMHLAGALFALTACLPTGEVLAQDLPKPIFQLSFEQSADAVIGGTPKPLRAESLNYAKGVKGDAVVLSKDSLLEYATAGNLNQEHGSVCLWFNPNWNPAEQPSDNKNAWHCLLSEAFPKEISGKDSRHGSGALWFWFWGPSLRGDLSDINDKYITGGLNGVDKGSWTHFAFTWDIDKGSALYVNGTPVGGGSDGDSPLDVKKHKDFSALKNKFTSFFVGSQEEGSRLDGLVDELKIYDSALNKEQVIADMAQVRPLSLNLGKANITAGVETLFSWTLKNPSKQAYDGDCAWQLANADGKVLAQGEIKDLALKAGASETYEAKLPTLSKGQYKFSVSPNVGPAFSSCVWVIGKDNPYLKEAGKMDTTPLETIDFVKGVQPERFVSIGNLKKCELSGRSYLEAGVKKNDRFAVKVDLPEAKVPYLIEWDYPDDKARTMEMVAQDAMSPGNDYAMQTGVFCGDEYPNSMKTLTHRSILWARSKTVALIFTTAREDAPVAVSELRISKINGGLPDAAVKDAAPVNAWNRVVGIHFEDPAIGYDFGLEGQLMPQYEQTLDRLVAYMKWSGQNFLSYPAVWYQGRIGASYQPRPHEEDYIGLILDKFSANGLYFMPSINLQNIKLPNDVIVNAKTVEDGSLHNSAIMIFSDGKPNPGGWHGTPPNFNPLHPDIQKYVNAQIDDMLERYSSSPAFKGIVLHLTKHTIPWFGSIEAGYNDYNIEAFEKDSGLKVAVDRKAPLRGKLYYEWLMANARDQWIQWRCKKIADWYKQIAARIYAKRPDLKLEICSYNPTVTDHNNDPRLGDPGFAFAIDNESGLDSKFYEGVPNIIISQTLYPADYRWTAGRKNFDAGRNAIRDDHFKPGVYAILKNASDPWINMHDRYFENAIGRPGKWWGGTGNPLQAPWLTEIGWRVSTLNPNRNYFLEHYILPLRYEDIQGFTKGGFLIGTCGVEDKLVEFARAFRALPAVKFSDVKGATDTVKVRSFSDKDSTWLYAVNTEHEAAIVEIPGAALTELSSGDKLQGSKIELAPYQLRSFKLASGAKINEVKCSKP